MRRISLALFVTLITITTVKAQPKFRAGIHTGVDVATLRISSTSGGPLQKKTELTAGLSFEAQVSSMFSVQLEGNFSQQGTGVVSDDGATAGSYGLDYITIPLLAKLHANKQLSFYGGPQIGILMAAKVQQSGQPNVDAKDLFETTDYYAVLGTQYRFENGVFADARYHIGTQGLLKDNAGGNLKNQYFSIRIGYSFGVGKK